MLPHLDASLLAELLARARGIDDPGSRAALAEAVETDAFRAALGRIACGYDGGQIIPE